MIKCCHSPHDTSFAHKNVMLPREMLRLQEKVLRFPNKFSIRTQYMCSSTRHLHFLKKLSIYTLKLCISPQETVCLHLKNLYCPKIMLHSHDKLYIGWQELCIYPSNTFLRVKCPDINEKHTHELQACCLPQTLVSSSLSLEGVIVI